MAPTRKHFYIEYCGHRYGIATLRALIVVRDNPEIHPWDAAVFLWPTSSSSRKWYKGKSNGDVLSKGHWLAAGSYMSRLARRGLLLKEEIREEPTYTAMTVAYTITEHGLELLELIAAEYERVFGVKYEQV